MGVQSVDFAGKYYERLAIDFLGRVEYTKADVMGISRIKWGIETRRKRCRLKE